ncbi:hypothetical protein [Desulfobacula toluolica]|uniref:Uncharacterized protein n=1 Tax=Desulfobacula toluolica (strain DSM 7467 / Tol2) TaxID=651182 RepID=K0NL27_DESTT|nr:hypothetical protein [Desulfobacula toluolica]CCK82286.1 uncharacterized protein TOL2_C41300 [Desulfobacula toluolica Tol2]
MTRYLLIRLMGAVFYFFVTGYGHAAVDDLQMHLLNAYDLPLRWDNIENKKNIIEGPCPRYSREYRMHLITLEPGEAVKVKIPEQRMLRLISQDHETGLAPLKISMSNGTGLHAFLKVPMTPDKLSALIDPDTNDPVICKIFLPTDIKQNISIALFFSRQEHLGTLAPARTLIPLDGTAVSVSHQDTAGSASFWRLTADKPSRISLDGPVRLVVENRLVYPERESFRRLRYGLKVFMDEKTHAVLDFETVPESSRLIFINGIPRVCGRIKTSFLTLPKGNHTLTLVPRSDLIVRVIKQEDPDYLLAKFNAPKTYKKSMDTVLSQKTVVMPLNKMFDIIPNPAFSFSQIEAAAKKTAQDNTRPQSGLFSASLMEKLAETRPDAPQLKREAKNLYEGHTFFRNLLPRIKPDNKSQERLGFILPRLRRAGDTRMVVAQQHRQRLVSLIQKGYFLSVPNDKTRPLVYTIPKRTAWSKLRVILEPGNGSKNFFVQFNGKPKLCFTAETKYDVTQDMFRITPAEAGLVLRQLEKTLSDPCLDPKKLIQPSYFELDLPPGADEFSLWGEKKFTGRAAIQYLDSKPYVMSESDYLWIGKHKKICPGLFDDFAARLSSGRSTKFSKSYEEGQENISRNLKNFQTSLVRMIRSNHALFTASQADTQAASKANQRPGKADHRAACTAFQTDCQAVKRSYPFGAMFSDARTNALVKKARYLEDQNQALPALEKWSAVFHNTAGQIRCTAALKIADQLMSLGETYLAEAWLKQLFINAAQPVSDSAFERLLKFYRQAEDCSQVMALYCTRAVRYPTPNHIRDLTQLLVEQGQFSQALFLAAVLPSDIQPVMPLLKAAGTLGWVRVYDDLVTRLNSSEQAAYWTGMGLLYQSKPEQACEILDSAGKPGKILQTAVERGLEINSALFSATPAKRLQGILDWEAWSSGLPLDYHWQTASDSVMDYDGSVTLYTLPRDLYSQSFRAVPSKPVTARFHGPGTLKVIVRVLHEQTDKLPDTMPMNGWFTIQHNNKDHLVPIVNNLPVQAMVISGDNTHTPGTSISHDINLIPGANDIEVYSATTPLLAAFQVLRPDRPLTGILPQLTTANVDAVLKGQIMQSSCSGGSAAARELAGYDSHSPKTLPQIPVLSRKDLENRRKAKQQVKTPEPLYPDTSYLEPFSKQGFSSEKDLVFKTMSQLVLAAEKHPENILQIEADARQLFTKYSHLKGLKGLLGQITRQTSWEPVSMVEANAGIESFPLAGWEPESDTLRIRKALLSPVSSGEQIITKENNLVLFMNNTRPVLLKADISLLDLPFLQPAFVKFFYQLDDQAPEFITLFPGMTAHQAAIRVSKGSHRLTIGISDSYSNQFLKVKFCENPSVTKTYSAGKSVGKPLTNSTCTELLTDNPPKRSFYRATHKDPVRVHIQGPAWIRIDTLKNNDTRVEHQYMNPGWHTLVLEPDKNESQALFRVHRRAKAIFPPDPLNPRLVKADFDLVPAPHENFLQDFSPGNTVCFQDTYALGSQEDGTWSLAGSYKNLFNSLEDEAEEDQGHIYEILATHHYYHETLPGYTDTGFLTRFRQNAGPVIGLTQDFYYYPRQVPLGLNLTGRIYLQNPDADTFAMFDNSPAEYSGLFKARIFQKRPLYLKFGLNSGLKAFHIPSFSLFGRILSMDDANQYPNRLVDRDIFTDYKNDHRAGATLSEYASYMPWLDTVWFLQGSISSNENMNLLQPDNMKMKIGWKQLLGNFQANLSYGHRYYFSDEDRSADIKRNTGTLELFWNHWTRDQQRLTLGLTLEQDLDNSDTAIEFSGVWFFSKGRGLKDIRPGALDFFNIHKRNMPQKNNTFIRNH